ncbi:hypothetical protein L1887_16519 [Cichorium endivia]|nr:hypothetical protein L1887_16519 [Cichorium endivia]
MTEAMKKIGDGSVKELIQCLYKVVSGLNKDTQKSFASSLFLALLKPNRKNKQFTCGAMVGDGVDGQIRTNSICSSICRFVFPININLSTRFQHPGQRATEVRHGHLRSIRVTEVAAD